jgi:p-methyltransferase
VDCLVLGYKQESTEERKFMTSMDSSAYFDSRLQWIEYRNVSYYYLELISEILKSDNIGLNSPGNNPGLNVNEIPSLAPIFLTFYLRKNRINTEMINYFNHETGKLINLLNEKPLCTVITTTFYTSVKSIKSIIKFIRQINSDTKIIVGGPFIHNRFHISAGSEFEEILKVFAADYYINEFQGEKTLLKLVRELSDNQGRNIDQLKNIIYFKGGKLIRQAREKENNRMDSGTIDWSLIDRNYIGSTLNIRTSIGCPYRCSFCNHPVRAGIYDLSDIKAIGEELDRIKDVGITKNIIFVDDTLNVPRKRFKELCKLMIEREYDFNWFSYFRINEADEETIKLMKESGCTGLFLGIESGDNDILKNMNKNANTATYLENINLLNKYDIFSFGNFVVGFPGETSESLERTVDFIKKSNLTFYKMNLWYADRSTPIFKQNDKWKITGDRFNETMPVMPVYSKYWIMM